MRKKVTLLAASALAAGILTTGAGPAYACHDDIFISENPIHNWACGTVDETGIEEKVEAYLRELYCTITQDPACG